jgi:hypothetical protein
LSPAAAEEELRRIMLAAAAGPEVFVPALLMQFLLLNLFLSLSVPVVPAARPVPLRPPREILGAILFLDQ